MVPMQIILEPLVGLKPIKLKCVTQEHFLPYHCAGMLVCMSLNETLSVQTTALMMQGLWSGSLTLALVHYISRHLQRLYTVSH